MTNDAFLEELFANEAFVEKLNQVEGKNQLQALFAENGVDLSRDEVDQLVAEVQNYDADQDELDDTQLENVSGGAITVSKLIGYCIKAVKIGWKAGKKFYDWEQSLYK